MMKMSLLSFRWLLSLRICSSSTVLTVFHNHHSISINGPSLNIWTHVKIRRFFSRSFLLHISFRCDWIALFCCLSCCNVKHVDEKNVLHENFNKFCSPLALFSPLFDCQIYFDQHSYNCLLFSSKRAPEIDDTTNGEKKSHWSIKLLMGSSVNQNNS